MLTPQAYLETGLKIIINTSTIEQPLIAITKITIMPIIGVTLRIDILL